jgi:superfamily I DNA/RNA helicase
VRNKFRPANTFSVHRWVGADDPKLAVRTEVRIRLDEQQAKIASLKVDDVMLLSGPPGSGKTLVLFARARLLAQEHPDWKIVLVVYTKNLAASFREKSLDMPDNVSIITIKEFLNQRNVGRFAEFIFPKEDDDAEEVAKKAERELKRIEDYGIPRDVDAMLIDEWQDFPAPYLRYLFSTVRKNRGGTVLAGDERQSIFLDEPADETLKKRTVKKVSLKYPYRSTKEILAVAQALDDSAPKIDVGMALSGEPVSMVKCVNWMGQADAIAREVRVLLDKGRRAGDIAVLVTKRTGARNYVCAALDEAGIPNVNLTAYWENPTRSRSKVSVMTVHSAKGDEFQAVFVHGFEIIRPAPKSGVGKKWENVAYVAVTRAQDLLFIMHSKSEGFVPSLNNCSDSVLARRLYPDDYE